MRRFDSEIEEIHEKLHSMGGLTVKQTRDVLQAFKNKDIEAASKVIRRDREVDEMELVIDDMVVKTMARRSPLGPDLRMMMAISKAVTDLERIGDEAVKVAGMTLHIYDSDGSEPSRALVRDVSTMGRFALELLKNAIEAFYARDSYRADSIANGENHLAEQFQSELRRLMTFVMEDVRNMGHAINLVEIIKALERIGEHARNLAQYAIYSARGEDVRHMNRDDNDN